jgi:hypothetical protein
LYAEYLPPPRVGIVFCTLALLYLLRGKVASDRGRWAIVGSVGGLGAVFLMVEILGALGFFQEQIPARWVPDDSLILSVVVFTIMAGAVVLLSSSPRLRIIPTACAVSLCLAYVSYAAPGGVGMKTVHLPGSLPMTPWLQVQLWAKENTAKDAVFLVPWKRSGFPVFSHRGIVGDWKSGGDSKFSFVFAQKWQEWKSDFGNSKEFRTREFCHLGKKYRFQYIVTERGQRLQFPVVYENQEFAIYRYAGESCR